MSEKLIFRSLSDIDHRAKPSDIEMLIIIMSESKDGVRLIDLGFFSEGLTETVGVTLTGFKADSFGQLKILQESTQSLAFSNGTTC